ncbi:poly(A) RNA polymerase GLD2-A-like [Anneissia japonica]|uniref:poly(A) RNA polymerase GLD2-A-like n=1 Tax=Anneissia japonica TaxID=1529436 RepID=UPI0014259532|nr:poly(A) RNA polymerase GLD2-A-like [Anneissia japonica]
MYHQRPYVNPNGFILRTPVYQQQGGHQTANRTRTSTISYPPPVILSQQKMMSGPGAYSRDGMNSSLTSRNTYDDKYRTPTVHQPPWSNPVHRYDGRNRGPSLPRKRVFPDHNEEGQVNRKRRREPENSNASTSKKLKSTGAPATNSEASSNYTPTSLTDTDMLSQDILENFLKKKQTKADLRKKVALRNELVQVIKKLYPYGGLFLVGSSMNGFGSTDSDVDMCLIISDNSISQRIQAKQILHRLLSELSRQCYHFMRKALVIPAKVPILKFFDGIRNLECDLNINNATGIRNTYLLQLYSKLDWRVAPLVLTIKQWASEVGINDASQGTLSSYSIVLMVLYYLQVGPKPPVLISLQHIYPQKFVSNASVWDLQNLAPEDDLPSWISFRSTNKQSFRELLEGFILFYTSTFHFDRDVVSVRLGRPLALNTIEHIGDWKKKFIHIEEPFDKTNTARAVYSEPNFRKIMTALRRASNKLSKNKNLKVQDLCVLR